MTTPTVRGKALRDAAGGIVIYFGECCREWPLAYGAPVGSCGLCGERPTFKRWGTEADQ